MTVRSTVGCAAVLLILAATPAGAQRQTPGSLDAIDKWVKMVDAHVPGRPDASLGAVVAMRYDTRRNLNTALPLFIRVLREREVVVTRSGFDQAVTRLARSVRLEIGSATFLKRAAVLHADAVVFANRFPHGPDDAPRPPVGAGRSPQRVAPLLSNQRVVLTRDGEIIADAPPTGTCRLREACSMSCSAPSTTSCRPPSARRTRRAGSPTCRPVSPIGRASSSRCVRCRPPIGRSLASGITRWPRISSPRE